MDPLILVTGATGFVGSHLVPRLVREGKQVRCLVRNPLKAEPLRELGAKLVPGDVAVPESLVRAMLGVEAVIHLVAIIREGRKATFWGVNVEGTMNIVQAAQEVGVKHFIHMSALGAGPNPEYRYTYSKWLGEQAVKVSRLEWVIFRPSVMFGEGFSFIDGLVRSLRMLPLIAPVPGSGRARFQPISVEDVVSCLVQTLDSGRARQVYEIGGPQHLTYEEMLEIIMSTLGIKRGKIHIPLPLMRAMATVMERVMANPPVTLTELKQLDLDNTTRLDAVEKGFGFSPLPLAQGLDYIRRR